MTRALSRLRARLHHLRHCNRGVITIELCLLMPLLLLTTLGAVDAAEYILAHQKLQRAAVAGADLVAQAEDITNTELSNIWAGIKSVTEPMNLDNGRVIITSIGRNANNNGNIINWQRKYGTLAINSVVGNTVGGTATVPASTMSSTNNYTLVACEVTFDFSPRMIGWFLIGPKRISQTSYFRARLGSLKTVINS